MKTTKRNLRRIGFAQEERAARFLEAKGYRILGRNLHAGRAGELDILAEKDGVVCAAEVKYRSSDAYGDPLEAIDQKKRRRFCRAALYYFTKYGYYGKTPCRLDAIGVYGDGSIRHIENAFPFSL